MKDSKNETRLIAIIGIGMLIFAGIMFGTCVIGRHSEDSPQRVVCECGNR